jgi:putative hemolysin
MAKVKSITTRVCDEFAVRNLAASEQREVAALAYKYWLARGFHDGSPQEDWLRAQRVVCRIRLRA